jgi:hypothetical protein
MTQEAVKALADKDLALVIGWAQDEQRARAEQRKHDTIAKIKELAGAAGVSITINNRRGRPPKAKHELMTGKSAKA